MIADALAGHYHQVQVRGRDEVNTNAQWSDWTSMILIKPWEGQKKQKSQADVM